ncbi:hypothetical protein ASF14_13965 [Sphingomonas sp. Leaf257]|nr:hypothetical protein ASF14_13965 [Sphingomonas sp. Leaf257]
MLDPGSPYQISGWLRRAVTALVTLLALTVATIALRHIAAETSWDRIAADIVQISPIRLTVAAVLTVASYVTLIGYDVLALRVVGRRVGTGAAALASFTSYVFSHNFGFATVTGGIARWRIYRSKGLTPGEVAQVMVMTGVTFWMGVFLILGGAFVVATDPVTVVGVSVGAPHLHMVGASTLTALLHYRSGRTMSLLGWVVTLPTARIAGAQFMLATLDHMLAAAVVFTLMPAMPVSDFPLVLIAYLLALIAGLVTHAPGGVGVFEVMMVMALPHLDRSALLASLLLYRLVYFLVPLAFGLALFAGHEWRMRNPTRS